ncbi:unnamed protein product [Mytilus coruscus]|uniref:Uncharacterized protein n=1 Tax=Mytilus coruscus TaxID=42192 RepID=A0A6J8E354_MYTCO|nr:unnamed protein product [Mytilus coruscus]
MVSRTERKSCILILCVMIVFLLAELPRIYVSSTLFSTYRSNLDMDNAALHKTKTELSQRFAVCLDDIPNVNIADDSCNSDFDELSSHHKEVLTNELEEFTQMLEYTMLHTIDLDYKQLLKQNFFEYLVDVFVDKNYLYAREFKKYAKQNYFDIAVKTYCNGTRKNVRETMFVLGKIYNCLLAIDDINISFAILGSSPYNEAMNYIMNIIWGHIDISLEHL